MRMVGYLVAIFNNGQKLADASAGQIRVQKLDLTSVYELGFSLKLVPTDLHGPGPSMS
jgi:hypothetical protein